jgi:uncharacterized protein YraI
VEGNQTETNFRTLLEVAQARGFKAAVDFETSGPFFGDIAAVTNGLAMLLATHAQHPAYLRYQGKPVIFFWRQQRFSVDEWLNIRNQVDPGRSTLWIAEGVDIVYQAVFDGHHLYSIAWAASPAGQLAKWAEQVRAYEAAHQVDRLWVATAMPGYNDTRLPRANAFAVSRRNGDYYRETWQGAVASQPDMILITSFNEWPEGTHIEPSAGYGNLYLEVTRELVSSLSGNPAIQVSIPALAPAAQEGQESPPEAAEDQAGGQESPPVAPGAQPPAGPYIQTGGITNVRRGPDTSFETVGRLDAAQTVTVTGRLESGDWWQIEFEPAPEGKGWVSAEVVDFFGDEDEVAIVEPPTLPLVEEADSAAEATGEAETDEATIEEAGETGPEAESSLATAEAVAEVLAAIRVPVGGVNVRSGPGLNFELLGRLEQDATAIVVARNDVGDWWQIEYEAGENGLGWVAGAVVDFNGDSDSLPVAVDNSVAVGTPTPTPSGPVGLIEALDAINVRSEPSTDGSVIGGLYQGYTADVLSISGDGEWWQIEFADSPDQTAWVAAEFVRFEGDRSQVPIFGLGIPTPTLAPTDTPTITPTAAPVELSQPTFAPTATSIYEATSAALLAKRGTPDPSLIETSSGSGSSFSWSSIPWGILSILVIAGFFWFQFVQRRQR